MLVHVGGPHASPPDAVTKIPKIVDNVAIIVFRPCAIELGRAPDLREEIRSRICVGLRVHPHRQDHFAVRRVAVP